jgi:hypothetical protein
LLKVVLELARSSAWSYGKVFDGSWSAVDYMAKNQ